MTNPIIEQLTTRRSIRAFNGEPVSDAHLDAILKATLQAPTSINAQQVSVVVVRDKDRIAEIADVCGGQPQVATADVIVVFLIDFNRTAVAAALQGVEQIVETQAEGLLVGGVDVGLALAAFQTAAESFGYGTTAIGATRADVPRMVELLNLPPRTYPVVASTIGVPDQTKMPLVKPRVPLASFAHQEHYDQDAVAAGVTEYDATLRTWWDDQGLTDMPSYVAETANTYATSYCPQVATSLREQGFGFSD